MAIEEQENAFVVQAVAAHPFVQTWASLNNWGQQLLMYYVDDPIKNPHYYLTNDYWSTTNLPLLINTAKDCGRDHWGCGFKLSIDGSIWLHGFILFLGLGLIAWRLTRRDIFGRFNAAGRWMGNRLWLIACGSAGLSCEAPLAPAQSWDDDACGGLGMALILLVAVVVINAFVCGALSGPFPRYQARLTWGITEGGALAALSLAPVLAALKQLDWLTRIRAAALRQWARRRERRVDPAFLRFGLVGVAGFTVDYAVLHSLVGVRRPQSLRRPVRLLSGGGAGDLAAQSHLHLPQARRRTARCVRR